MSPPEIKIPLATPLLDADGKLTNENTRQYVEVPRILCRMEWPFKD